VTTGAVATQHDGNVTAAGIQGCCFRIVKSQVAQLIVGASGVAVCRTQDSNDGYESDCLCGANSVLEL
jgi:hypothetical protein